MDNNHKISAPFGYILEDSDSRDEQEASRPGGQQHLLSVEERNNIFGEFDFFLSNENMANSNAIDPTLWNGADADTTNQNTYTNLNGNDFDFPSTMPPYQSSTLRTSDAKPQSVPAGPSSAQTMAPFGVGPQNQPIMSSQNIGETDDVFNAAQRLREIGGYSGQQGSAGSSQYAQANMSSSYPAYPGIPQSQQNLPYSTYNNQHQSNSNYNDTVQQLLAQTSEQSQSSYKRPQGLAFGSDDKFREGGEYKSAAGQEYPDLGLLQTALASGMSEDRKPGQHYSGDMSPTSGNDSYNGDDMQQGRPRKRSRRDHSQDDRNDDDGDPSSAYSHRPSASTSAVTTKRLYRRAPTSATSPAAPRPKSSTAATINDLNDASPPGSSNGPNNDPSTPGATISKSGRQNLTEDQKRNNHIQSEQKRRNVIKQGFDDAKEMVPALRTTSCTKGAFLVEAARFARGLRDGNARMRALVEELEREEAERQSQMKLEGGNADKG